MSRPMYTTIACKTDATRARPRGLDLTARLRATVSVTAVPPRTRSPIRPDHSARVRSPRRLPVSRVGVSVRSGYRPNEILKN